MSPEFLQATIEALLFASEGPLSVKDILRVIGEAPEPEDALGSAAEQTSLTGTDVQASLAAICARYNEDAQCGFYLEEVAGGYQFRSKPQFAGFLRRLQKEKPYRISRGAMEVLSIVAYRQPVSRVEIEDVRGVDSSSAMKTLIERSLIRVVGRSEDVGRPVLYGTTAFFLEVFNLKDLEDLPPLTAPAQLAEEWGTPSNASPSTDAEADARALSFEKRFREHLIRLAEESQVDSALLDDLQDEMLKVAGAESQLLENALSKAPDPVSEVHATTPAETDLRDGARLASKGGGLD